MKKVLYSIAGCYSTDITSETSDGLVGLLRVAEAKTSMPEKDSLVTQIPRKWPRPAAKAGNQREGTTVSVSTVKGRPEQSSVVRYGNLNSRLS